MTPIHGITHVRLNTNSTESISPTTGGFTKGASNSLWSRVVSALALVALAGTSIACGAGLAAQGGPKIAKDQTKITGQALLVGDQAEMTGYGLYSYVLFDSPPTTETTPIYLAVISACIKEFPDLVGLAQKYRPESLNAMYIPVTATITGAKAEEILQQYNYERAKTILNRLSKTQRNGGPYLVSSLGPVSSGNGTSPFVFQDLSAVRLVSSQEDQRKMAYEWVLDFVDRVSNPQSLAWNRTTLENFGDELREARQPAFKRYNVRADSLELKKYIVFTMPDGKVERTAPYPAWKAGGGDAGPNSHSIVDQSRSIQKRVSFPNRTSPTLQRGGVYDGRYLDHG
jgi:hypothetical protein